MPLLDHFHPPLSDGQFWESFHSLWIAAMVEQLNGNILPQGYLAQAQVHIGGWFEVDVATFETAPLAQTGLRIRAASPSKLGRRRRRRWLSRPLIPTNWRCESLATELDRPWSRLSNWSVRETRIAPKRGEPSRPSASTIYRKEWD